MDKTLSASDDSYKYADLNIRHAGDPQKTIALVKRAVRMGYDTIGINIDIGDVSPNELVEEHDHDIEPPPTKKKRKHRSDPKKVREKRIPDPFTFDASLIDATSLEQQGRKLRIFTRLTFTLNDSSDVHNVFHDPQLKKYDIIAIRPGDENILNTLTRKTNDVDIICFDPYASRIPWTTKGKAMEQLRVEGIGFEICYGSVLLNREERRLALSHGRNVIRSIRSRGIILSSGAENIIDLRAPIDAMNMLCLWGVDGANARPMISGYPKQILLRCESRRTVRGSLHVTNIETKDNEPAAKVPTTLKNTQAALRRLLSVKEFHAQVEIVRKANEAGNIEDGIA